MNRISLDRRKMNTFTAEFDSEYRRIYFDAKLEETKLTRRVNPRPFVPSSKSKLFERCESEIYRNASTWALRSGSNILAART